MFKSKNNRQNQQNKGLDELDKIIQQWLVGDIKANTQIAMALSTTVAKTKEHDTEIDPAELVTLGLICGFKILLQGILERRIVIRVEDSATEASPPLEFLKEIFADPGNELNINGQPIPREKLAELIQCLEVEEARNEDVTQRARFN